VGGADKRWRQAHEFLPVQSATAAGCKRSRPEALSEDDDDDDAALSKRPRGGGGGGGASKAAAQEVILISDSDDEVGGGNESEQRQRAANYVDTAWSQRQVAAARLSALSAEAAAASAGVAAAAGAAAAGAAASRVGCSAFMSGLIQAMSQPNTTWGQADGEQMDGPLSFMDGRPNAVLVANRGQAPPS
jgi:hypothetical protein